MITTKTISTGTVTITVEEYNKLKKFYDGIEEGKFGFIESYKWAGFETIYFINETEIISKLKQQIEIYKEALDNSKKENDKFLTTLRKMNFYQFLKTYFNRK